MIWNKLCLVFFIFLTKKDLKFKIVNSSASFRDKIELSSKDVENFEKIKLFLYFIILFFF